MPPIVEWLSRFFGSWKFWLVVPPWDRGVRIRLGRNATQLEPGFHFRIPLVDEVVLVNTRLRIATSAPMTLANGSKATARVVSAMLGYRIADPLLAMGRFEKPQVALVGHLQALIVGGSKGDECTAALRRLVQDSGVEIEFVSFVEDVEVRAFRLLQNGWGIQDESFAGVAGRY